MKEPPILDIGPGDKAFSKSTELSGRMQAAIPSEEVRGSNPILSGELRAALIPIYLVKSPHQMRRSGVRIPSHSRIHTFVPLSYQHRECWKAHNFSEEHPVTWAHIQNREHLRPAL